MARNEGVWAPVPHGVEDPSSGENMPNKVDEVRFKAERVRLVVPLAFALDLSFSLDMGGVGGLEESCDAGVRLKGRLGSGRNSGGESVILEWIQKRFNTFSGQQRIRSVLQMRSRPGGEF